MCTKIYYDIIGKLHKYYVKSLLFYLNFLLLLKGSVFLKLRFRRRKTKSNQISVTKERYSFHIKFNDGGSLYVSTSPIDIQTDQSWYGRNPLVYDGKYDKMGRPVTSYFY